MKYLRLFIVISGPVMLLAGCGDTPPERRVEITPPVTELTFDEAFVKDRDIHFQMPEGVVLGAIRNIEVDSKGDLIVVDRIQQTVFLTDAEGNYLRQVGTRGGLGGEITCYISSLPKGSSVRRIR